MFCTELYPYGTNRDVKLKEGDDDIERVSVSTGFPFSDTTYHHFYVRNIIIIIIIVIVVGGVAMTTQLLLLNLFY